MVKLRKETRNPESYYLRDSQKIIGTYKQSLKCIQHLGINYPKLLSFFFPTQGMNPFFMTVINKFQGKYIFQASRIFF